MGRQIKIGDRTEELGAFGSYKAIVASDLMEEVIGELAKVVDQYRSWLAGFGGDNKRRFTRQGLRQEQAQWQELAAGARQRATDEADEERREAILENAANADANAAGAAAALADMGERDYIEIPRDPTREEIAMFLAPAVFKIKALRTKAMALLALAVTPDDALESAWLEDGDVSDLIEQKGRKLFMDLRLGQEVGIALAVWEVAEEQIRPHLDEAKKLASLVTTPQQTEEEPSSEPASTSAAPTSPTPSEGPTAGQPPSESSSATPTDSTSPSPVA